MTHLRRDPYLAVVCEYAVLQSLAVVDTLVLVSTLLNWSTRELSSNVAAQTKQHWLKKSPPSFADGGEIDRFTARANTRC